MIKMFNYFKLKNLEDERNVKRAEILKKGYKTTMLDLQELECITNKIMTLQLEMAGIKLELN